MEQVHVTPDLVCLAAFQQLLTDLKSHSENDVFDLVEKRWKGLARLRQIIGDQSLDYEPFGGYEIFTSADKLLSDECYEKLNYFNSELHRITGKKNIYGDTSTKIQEFGFSNIDRMLINNGEGQIDTGKMMKALLEKCRNVGIEILNGVDVTKIENENKFCRIDFNNGFSILSKKVLIAVNGFAQKFLPDYDIQPARAQVLITSPIQDLKFKGSFHYDLRILLFQKCCNRILFGGGKILILQRKLQLRADRNSSRFLDKY